MPGQLTETGTLYSPAVGLIYIFNLIVGTGALTMPRAFEAAGWLLSLIMIIALAFTSYMTVTFVIETMAAANAIRRLNRVDSTEQHGGMVDEQEVMGDTQTPVMEDIQENADEGSPLLNGHTNRSEDGEIHYFEITERIEMGQMAAMFFNSIGRNIFYLVIIIYLYGDLAIYAAAVPKSLRDVACTYTLRSDNASSCDINKSLQDNDPCWESVPGVNRINAYRIFLVVFLLLMGPFVFYNAQKTKYLQYFTTLMRWLAFGMMIVLAVIRLAKGEGKGKPQVANISGIPTLFGVCVYSFMCHHSLPSLATPIRDKSKITGLFAADYTLILVFYSVLSFTAIFAFRNIMDLYTLNFQPGGCNPATSIEFIQYFLALFPVFTLSTNFPIIAITLRNNLRTLCLSETRTYSYLYDKIFFPLLTIIPPAFIAFITNHIELLVGITGSYAGAGIQYFIPAALVYCSRKSVANNFQSPVKNKHRSPFSNTIWILLVSIWALVAVGLVSINYVINGI